MKKTFSLLLVLPLLALFLCGAGQADGGKVSTLREFAAAMDTHTALLEDSFMIPCEPSVTEELQKTSPIGTGGTYLNEIYSMSGACGSYKYSFTDSGVLLSNVSYYAGWRILCLWRGGRTDLLTPREKQTLDAALALVAGVTGSDLQKERYIFDALCARVTYETISGSDRLEENDCAIGALLNGRADCDGYADAMVLCCGLAGVPCRYMHGKATSPGLQNSSDGLHMWNLVCLDGTWLMTDVTWGDKSTPVYLYFNLGMLDASYSYRWCSETLFADVAVTADFSRHLMADQQPAVVHSMEDVYTAARTAATLRQSRLILFCPDMLLWNIDRETFNTMLSRGGLGNCSYHDSGRMFEIINITLPDVFCFCDSEEEVLAAISQCAAQDFRSFTLYFHPSLADALFADDHARLLRLFTSSCLAEPGKSYRYSEESGSVSLTDVSFTAQPPMCASADEVVALIRRELPSRPDSLTFVLAEGLSFSGMEDRVARAVYSMGASSLGYVMIGNRVTLAGLAYYPDYCLASSEADVSAYLRSAKSAGKASIRIYCPDALYTSLMANNASRFFDMLDRAGFSRYTLYYSADYGLINVEDLR